MKPQMKILLAGLGILTVTNAVALIGIAYNRSGEPEALIELTERELRKPYSYRSSKENTGLSLNINWRIPQKAESDYIYASDWLDHDKLIALGFDLPPTMTDISEVRTYEKLLPREVYLVLEYDGEMYQTSLQQKQSKLSAEQALFDKNPGNEEFSRRLKSAEQMLARERMEESRLFVIDAGLDAANLRARYGDRSHYLIMKGVVSAYLNHENNSYIVRGTVTTVSINHIHVPLEHRTILDPLESVWHGGDDIRGPRYTVTLATGKRLEPWIVDVKNYNE